MTTLRLYLRPHWPDKDAILPWALLTASGETTATGSGSPQEWPHTERIELVLPAGRSLFTQVRLPMATRSLTRNMIAFALEEKLANDPQANLYIVGDGPDKEGWCSVAVTEALPVERAVAMLKSLGRLVDSILPQEVWLPLPGAQEWSIAREETHWLIRWGKDAMNVVPILPNQNEKKLLQQLWNINSPTRLLACGQHTVTELEALGLPSDCIITLAPPYEWRRGYINTSFNFAHGKLAAHRRRSQWLPPIKRAGNILLLLLFAHIVVVASQAAWWGWRKAELAAVFAARRQQIMGKKEDNSYGVLAAMRTVDRQRLASGLPARESALALMAAFGTVMIPDGRVDTVVFEGGRLTVKLPEASTEQLTRWKRLLAERYVRLQVRALAGDEKELILSLEP